MLHCRKKLRINIKLISLIAIKVVARIRYIHAIRSQNDKNKANISIEIIYKKIHLIFTFTYLL